MHVNSSSIIEISMYIYILINANLKLAYHSSIITIIRPFYMALGTRDTDPPLLAPSPPSPETTFTLPPPASPETTCIHIIKLKSHYKLDKILIISSVYFSSFHFFFCGTLAFLAPLHVLHDSGNNSVFSVREINLQSIKVKT